MKEETTCGPDFSAWGCTSPIQIAMLKEVLNEEELDEFYSD